MDKSGEVNTEDVPKEVPIISLLQRRRSERSLITTTEDPKVVPSAQPDLVSRLALATNDISARSPITRTPSLLKALNSPNSTSGDDGQNESDVEQGLISRQNSFVKESLLDQMNPQREVEKSLKARFQRFRKRYAKSIPALEKKLNEIETTAGAILRFWDSYFRGVSQIAFVNNPIVGIGTLIIALITDTWIGTCGILGCFCTTLFAATGSLKKEIFRAGLFGFNGYLLGAIMAVFILTPWDWRTIVVIVVLAPLSIISQIAFSHIFVSFDTPPFGLPLLVVVNFFFLATYNSGYLHPVPYVATLPQAEQPLQEIRVDIVFESLGRCITRAFFTSSPWAYVPSTRALLTCDRSVAFLAMLVIHSPWHAIAAITGAVFNTLTLYLLGVNSEFIATGLWGWNSTLVSQYRLAYCFLANSVAGLALFGEFLQHSWRSWLYSVYAVIATTILQVGCASLFQVIGIPETSLPFSIVGIIFMAARKSLPGLEEHLIEQVAVDPVAARRKAFSRRRAVSRFMKL